MTLPISSTAFFSTRLLQTVRLAGRDESDGELHFSGDNDWILAWGEYGRLQIWHVDSRRQALCYEKQYIRGATYSRELGGVLAVAGGSLVYFRLNSDRESTCEILVASLPLLSEPYDADSLDANVTICLTPTHIVCGSRNCIVTVERSMLSRHIAVPLPEYGSRRTYHLSSRLQGSTAYIQVVTSVRIHDVTEYVFNTLSTKGETLTGATVRSPDSTLIPAPPSHARACRFGAVSGAVNIVNQSLSGEMGVYSLAGTDRETRLFASNAGHDLVGISSDLIRAWRRGVPIQTCEAIETPLDLKVSGNGKFACLMYHSEASTPGITGILDLESGQMIAHCYDHIGGAGPFAVSPSGRYIATMVTDTTCLYHPTDAPSGTIVLTDMG